jgi:phage-related protein
MVSKLAIMLGWVQHGGIEAEDEVDNTWLMKLSTRDAAQARFSLQLLTEHGNTLAMPHVHSLGNGLRELQFHLRDEQRRITFLDST